MLYIRIYTIVSLLSDVMADPELNKNLQQLVINLLKDDTINTVIKGVLVDIAKLPELNQVYILQF